MRASSAIFRRTAAAAFLAGMAAIAVAQVPEIPATKLAHPIMLNGDLTAPGWAACTFASKFQDPFTNSAAQDQTEAKIAYDDEAIYVAFYCHDSHPEGIVGREIDPESQFNGEDTVKFEIDTFNTRSGSSISQFTVNAINTRTESIAGGHSSKAEWRGIWQSFAKRVPDGYVVQMRVPWKILNYPKSAKPIDMDLNFDRYQARTKTLSQWANVTPSFKPELLGLWKGVVPPAKDNRTRWQFLAYDAPELNGKVVDNRAGIDVRYALTNQQTALLSVNPDFINIEQQIAGVGFVHTERFLNDARPFFTEGGGYYNPVGMFEWGSPFYSQRIGPINAGAKFYGQLSHNAKLGVLAVDEPNGSIAEFANYELDLGSTFSQSFFQSSFDGGGIHDRLLGTIVQKRWGDVFARLNSAGEDDGRRIHSAGDVAIGYSGPKLFTEIQPEWVDSSFNPPLAYVPWQNRHGAYTYTNYNDNFAHGPFHDWAFFMYAPDFYQADGTIQERGIQTGVTFTTRTDQMIGFNRNITDYLGGTDDNYEATYGINSSNRFKQVSFDYLFGRQGGLPSRYLDVRGSLRVLRRIDLGLEQSVLVFTPDARQTIATIGWQLDQRRSIAGRFVDTNGFRNFFLSFQSAGWTGTEMYVILGDPNAQTFSRRVSVKFVWAF